MAKDCNPQEQGHLWSFFGNEHWHLWNVCGLWMKYPKCWGGGGGGRWGRKQEGAAMAALVDTCHRRLHAVL